MKTSFDEAYAGYLSALKQLDQTQDIREKNLLFRQLTEQLSELEARLNVASRSASAEDPSAQWDHAAGQGSSRKIL